MLELWHMYSAKSTSEEDRARLMNGVAYLKPGAALGSASPKHIRAMLYIEVEAII